MKIKVLIFLIGISLILSSCSIGAFQYPRTLNKGKLELGIGTANSIYPNTYQDYYTNYTILSFVSYPDIFFRVGLEDNVDVGLRYWLPLGFMSDVKYMFIGDRESPFAASFDFEFGTTFQPFYYLTTSGLLIDLAAGLYFDYMPVDVISIYGGLKLRNVFNIENTYPEPIPVYNSSYYYGSTSPRGIPTFLTLMSTFGFALLPKYNYTILFEINFSKSLFSDMWAFAPCLGIKIKF